MIASASNFWRLASRALLVSLLAYVLVLQSVFLPLAQVKAAERAGLGIILADICSEDSRKGENPSSTHGHDLSCCIVCPRPSLDTPVAVLGSVDFIAEPSAEIRSFRFALHHSRAPPIEWTRTVQARAPPFNI